MQGDFEGQPLSLLDAKVDETQGSYQLPDINESLDRSDNAWDQILLLLWTPGRWFERTQGCERSDEKGRRLRQRLRMRQFFWAGRERGLTIHRSIRSSVRVASFIGYPVKSRVLSHEESVAGCCFIRMFCIRIKVNWSPVNKPEVL